MGQVPVRLAHDWREILRKAWSVRLFALAVLCAGIEALLQIAFDDCPPPLSLVLAILFFSLAGLVARFMAQRSMGD